MKHSRFFLAGMLSLFVALGHGMVGCGDDESTVTVDVGQLCAQSLQALNSQGCVDTAYAGVDDFKECLAACGPGDEECIDICLGAPGSGFSECTGDVEFLFSAECGECYTECGFDFVGVASPPGCLFDPNPAVTGEQCLDELYDCVDVC
jgi:hypothetical protein